jgi:hypothetical protein
MRRPLFCTGVPLFVLAIASDPANAQETRDARPDWTGYYVRASARDLAGTGFKQETRLQHARDRSDGRSLPGRTVRTFSVLLLLGVRTTRI